VGFQNISFIIDQETMKRFSEGKNLATKGRELKKKDFCLNQSKIKAIEAKSTSVYRWNATSLLLEWEQDIGDFMVYPSYKLF